MTDTTATWPDTDWRIIAHQTMPPTRCAKCGRAVGLNEYIMAPTNSKYAGNPVCLRCLDAPLPGQRWDMGPSEVKV